MKISRTIAAALAPVLMLTACGKSQTEPDRMSPEAADIVEIGLSDSEIRVGGAAAGSDAGNGVYISNDIVYYESGKDFTYGEGSEQDAHSADEAAEHTVVHISEPGAYRISGSLSKGQIAVDLGDEAKDDPEAVVTLILDGADITCEVAPAVIFYNVYECGSADPDEAGRNVDTSSAGANVIIADGTENTVSGSYVARIYEPGSVVLNEAGTEVEDAKKLHKYDAAFYSRMSMNINGGSEDSGVLTIRADNEGLDSELHLTVNGGIIRINSGNDGINTNEDGISVTTINGGELDIRVTGETGEGDGIDSNGWLVINGGTVRAQACAFSADAGIDSDMGIHINGGTVIASGNMLDRISESDQTYAVLNFAQFPGAGVYSMLNADGDVILEREIENSFTFLIVSSADLTEGDYTLRYGDEKLTGTAGGNGGMGGMPMMPPGGERPEMPDGAAPGQPGPGGEGMMPPGGFGGGKEFERNEDGAVVNPSEFEGKGPADRGPGGFGGDKPGGLPGESSEIFSIKPGENYFSMIRVKE